MKKNILFGLGLTALAGTAVAQRNAQLYSFDSDSRTQSAYGMIDRTAPGFQAKPTHQNSEKALNVVWTEDFTVVSPLETANGTWVTGGSNPTYWTIGTGTHIFTAYDVDLTGDHLRWNSYTPNSNETGGFATTPVGGEIVSPTIDLSSITDNEFGISFETQTTYCCNFNEKPWYIAVSTDDGATWSAPVAFDFGVDRNAPTEDIASPLEFATTISGITPTATTKIKLIWEGSSADGNGQYNTHYYWFLDDINIFTIPDYDLATTSNFWGSNGLNYFQIPLTQLAPIDFSANVTNNGASDITNVTLEVDINSGAWTGTSAAATVASGASDSLFTTTQFTPATVGAYAVTRAITQTEVDDLPADNTLSNINFAVTEHVYARDNGVSTGSISQVTSQDEASLAIGNIFDIFGDMDPTAISIRLMNQQAAVGQSVRGLLYILNGAGTEFEYLTQTEELIITNGDLNGFVNLLLIDDVTLPAGSSVLVMAQHDGGPEEVEFGYAQPTETGTVLGITADGEFFQLTDPNAIMVRLSDDPSASVASMSLEGVAIYPNPSTGIINVTNDLNVESTITVMDLTGKVVATKVASSATTLDLTNAGTGVYLVEVANANGMKVERVVIK